MIGALIATGVYVTGAWSRPALDTGVVYAAIHNRGRSAVVLRRISSPVARAAEVHASFEVRPTGAMAGMPAMGMRPLRAVSIPPHGELVLRPGRDHIMLEGLRRPLRQGDVFLLTLRFSDGSTVDVRVTVGDRDVAG